VTSDKRRAGWRGTAALAMTLALSAGYLWVGTRPRPPRALEDVPDTATHLAGYAVLSLSATLTAAELALAPAAAWGAGWAVAHGALLEVLQSRTATRRAEWADLAADALGAAVGAAVGTATARRRRPAP
jgi:VanZ family protein